MFGYEFCAVFGLKTMTRSDHFGISWWLCSSKCGAHLSKRTWVHLTGRDSSTWNDVKNVNMNHRSGISMLKRAWWFKWGLTFKWASGPAVMRLSDTSQTRDPLPNELKDVRWPTVAVSKSKESSWTTKKNGNCNNKRPPMKLNWTSSFDTSLGLGNFIKR